MSPLGICWMDEDGYHVWYAHDCIRPSGERHTLHTMLPHPGWRKSEGDAPTVTPSIVCTVPACGFHSTPLIGEPPADWKPLDGDGERS